MVTEWLSSVQVVLGALFVIVHVSAVSELLTRTVNNQLRPLPGAALILARKLDSVPATIGT